MFFFMMVFLVLVLIRPQEYPQWADSLTVPLLPIVLLVAALFWLFSQRRSFAAPQYILLPAFLLVLMMSKVANGWAGGAVEQLTKFLPVVLAFVLLANAANTRERIVTAMAVFSVCGAVLALHGIEQAQLGVGWTGVGLSQETRIQYVGIFNDPNDLGMLFVMCLPMAMYLSGRGGMMGMRRLFWLLVAGLLLYGVYLTNSRGTLLAVLVLLGLYVWRRYGLFLAGVLGSAGLVAMAALSTRFQEMEVGEESAMGRVESWYQGMQMFISRPILGVGADAYSDYHDLTAHNSLVLVLAETGAIGFCVWIAFVGYGFLMMLAVARHRGAPAPGAAGAAGAAAAPAPDAAQQEGWKQDRAIARALLLSQCGYLVTGFFLSRSYVIILYLLAALVVAHYVGMRERYPLLPEFRLSRDLLRWALWTMVGIVGLYFVVKILFALA